MIAAAVSSSWGAHAQQSHVYCCPSARGAAKWQGRPGGPRQAAGAGSMRRSSPIQLWREHHDETSTAPHAPEPCGCFAISGIFSSVSAQPDARDPSTPHTQPSPPATCSPFVLLSPVTTGNLQQQTPLDRRPLIGLPTAFPSARCGRIGRHRPAVACLAGVSPDLYSWALLMHPSDDDHRRNGATC